jgi:hypothetical protein
MLVRGNSGSALPSTAGLSLQSSALLFLFQIPPPFPAFVTASSKDPLAFRSHHLEAKALVWISGGPGLTADLKSVPRVPSILPDWQSALAFFNVTP